MKNFLTFSIKESKPFFFPFNLYEFGEPIIILSISKGEDDKSLTALAIFSMIDPEPSENFPYLFGIYLGLLKTPLIEDRALLR